MLIRKMFMARAALVFLLSVQGGMSSAWAGIPVIDGLSLAKAALAVEESIKHTVLLNNQFTTLKDQLTTQKDQLQNMAKNTEAPAASAYIWDQASATMDQLRASIDTLSRHKNQGDSIDDYLSQFKDVASYRSSPCFSGGVCTQEDREALNGNDFGSKAQKESNDALFRSLDRQITALKTDADKLQRLQAGAQGATGQMQAIQFASQLASHQSNQLLQIRGLLIAQQNAIATRNQALASREAIEAASSTQVRRGTFVPSPARNWRW